MFEETLTSTRGKAIRFRYSTKGLMNNGAGELLVALCWAENLKQIINMLVWPYHIVLPLGTAPLIQAERRSLSASRYF